MNKDGTLANLYRWTYACTKEALPNNLCPFFWKLLIAVLIFPVTWLSYPYGFRIRRGNHDVIDYSFSKNSNYDRHTFMVIKRFVTGIIGYFFLLLLALLIVTVAQAKVDWIDIFYNMLQILAFVAVSIVLIIIGIAGVVLLKIAFGSIREKEAYNEVTTIIKDRKDGFFNKYCPKINWRDGNEK